MTDYRESIRETLAWQQERADKRWLEENPFAAKAALDALKETVKIIDRLLRYERLSPEAVGFTSRKIGNLIKSLEELKKRMES